MDARQKQFLLIGIVLSVLAIGTLIAFYMSYMQETGGDVSLTDEHRIEAEEEPEAVASDQGDILIVEPEAIQIPHSASGDTCPNLFDGRIRITGLEQGAWTVDRNSVPQWLAFNELSGSFPGEIAGMAFNCAVESLEPRVLSARINIQAKNEAGQAVDTAFFDVFIQITE